MSDILHTEGEFRLCRLLYAHGITWTYIEHNCRLYQVPAWQGFVSSADRAHIHCWSCKQTVPDGLQAVFWMMDENG